MGKRGAFRQIPGCAAKKTDRPAPCGYFAIQDWISSAKCVIVIAERQIPARICRHRAASDQPPLSRASPMPVSISTLFPHSHNRAHGKHSEAVLILAAAGCFSLFSGGFANLRGFSCLKQTNLCICMFLSVEPLEKFYKMWYNINKYQKTGLRIQKKCAE